jgi:ankyrin repeat protein
MFHSRYISASIALLLAFSLPVEGFAASKAETEAATKLLVANKISVDNDSFIAEVKAGRIDNVRAFLTLGTHAGTQDKEGTPAIIAALAAPGQDMFNLLLATLPENASASAVLNLKDKSGNTALLKAVELGNEPVVEALIARGANISLTNNTRTTPLILAVRQKNETLVKKLLAADETALKPFLTLEMADSRGNKALSYAIIQQSPALVKLLLGARVDAVLPDTIGVTPLMLAAEGGDESIALMLLAAGAKINDTNKAGNTPVSIAIRHGHSKLAKLFIQKNPDRSSPVNVTSAMKVALEAETIDAEFFAYLLEQTSKIDALPPSLLFAALDRKNHAVATLLIARNPDVSVLNENNETLFYHAIDSGFEDIALKIMSLGADTSQTGVAGISPIARAVRHNMAKVVAALIAKGASADQKTPEGYTLAEMCVYSGYPETLEVLLSKGVKLEKEFALLWAIRDGKGKAVPVLLAHGAVPNIMNQDGTPAILLAAEAGETEAVKAFIAHKATLDHPSKAQNLTAMAAASHAGHLEVVRMLVEAGANMEAVDNFGMTPLAHATVLGKADVVEYLLSKGANAKAIDGQKRSVQDIAGQAPASPERDRILQLLMKASEAPKP